MRYVVETRMGDVWEAVWSEDQEPMVFASEEEAEVEIAETLEDLQEAYELGDMSSPMTRDEFRIVSLDAPEPLFVHRWNPPMNFGKGENQ